MADAIQHQTMNKFMGVDNVSDPIRLVPIVVNHEYVYPLWQANNMEIDDTYGLSSRSGYDDVLSGSDIHSMWSDGVICLYVDGGTLKQLYSDYTTHDLRSGLTLGARMSYTSFNDRIYYTNGYEIGYVQLIIDYPLVDPVLEFKLPLPAGQFIECFMACLYVAVGKVLYISDPLCDYYDVRTGYRRFNEQITMLRAVDDGLYVSDDRIWFVKGKGNEDFECIEVYSHRTISYTDICINGQDVGDGMKGNIAIWTGENGICAGNNDGVVVNLTESRYTFAFTNQGAGFVRSKNNVQHYINSLY